MIEGGQEAAIEAFLVAHEGHTQEVEVQRGTWSIYYHCKRCGEIHAYEVDNEARQALGLPPGQEEDKEALFTEVRGRRILRTSSLRSSEKFSLGLRSGVESEG
jgi:hypothetical protein